MQSETQKKVVLVVEDDEALLDLTTLQMTALGYAVLTAKSAEEALDILGSDTQVDLLFTDEVLPRASGRELAHAARSLRPPLPVLLTSGLPRTAFGPLDDVTPIPLLSKPYRPGELERFVREAMESC